MLAACWAVESEPSLAAVVSAADSCASADVSEASSALVSIAARTVPFRTVSPASTRTFVTAPLDPNDSVADRAGSSVPVPVTVSRTVEVVASAVVVVAVAPSASGRVTNQVVAAATMTTASATSLRRRVPSRLAILRMQSSHGCLGRLSGTRMWGPCDVPVGPLCNCQ